MGYHVEVNRIKLYVEDLNPGGEKTILFLHGWPGNHKLFEYQFDRLPLAGIRCIGLDTRGFGHSDKPFDGYDYNTLADDVRGVVEALGLKDFTLLGHSTGGAIAARSMNRHQAFGVAKLVLVAAAAPSLIRRPQFPYGLERKTVEEIIGGTLQDRPQMLRQFALKFFFQHTSPAFLDWFFQLGLQAAGWATAAIANTWINEELFADLESIRVPTLILHGIHDQVVPFQLGEIQHRMIRHSVLVPIQFSGHGSFYDEKDVFNDLLIQFMENR